MKNFKLNLVHGMRWFSSSNLKLSTHPQARLGIFKPKMAPVRVSAWKTDDLMEK